MEQQRDEQPTRCGVRTGPTQKRALRQLSTYLSNDTLTHNQRKLTGVRNEEEEGGEKQMARKHVSGLLKDSALFYNTVVRRWRCHNLNACRAHLLENPEG